jgi:hypothetical protein
MGVVALVLSDTEHFSYDNDEQQCKAYRCHVEELRWRSVRASSLYTARTRQATASIRDGRTRSLHSLSASHSRNRINDDP